MPYLPRFNRYQQQPSSAPPATPRKPFGTILRDARGHALPGEYDRNTGTPLAGIGVPGGPGQPMTRPHDFSAFEAAFGGPRNPPLYDSQNGSSAPRPWSPADEDPRQAAEDDARAFGPVAPPAGFPQPNGFARTGVIDPVRVPVGIPFVSPGGYGASVNVADDGGARARRIQYSDLMSSMNQLHPGFAAMTPEQKGNVFRLIAGLAPATPPAPAALIAAIGAGSAKAAPKPAAPAAPSNDTVEEPGFEESTTPYAGMGPDPMQNYGGASGDSEYAKALERAMQASAASAAATAKPGDPPLQPPTFAPPGMTDEEFERVNNAAFDRVNQRASSGSSAAPASAAYPPPASGESPALPPQTSTFPAAPKSPLLDFGGNVPPWMLYSGLANGSDGPSASPSALWARVTAPVPLRRATPIEEDERPSNESENG